MEQERITDPARVVGLLRRLHRRLLSVTLPHDIGESYTSAVLAVEPAAGRLLLDGLIPARGHDRLLAAGTLRASARLRGVHLSFSTRLLEALGPADRPCYRVALPDGLLYAERRQSFRARVGWTHESRLEIPRAPAAPLSIPVMNLSDGGLCAELPAGTALQPGERLHDCRLLLPDGMRLACTVDVRAVRTDDDAPRAFAGFRFHGLTPIQRRVVRRCVARLDRERLRRTRRP